MGLNFFRAWEFDAVKNARELLSHAKMRCWRIPEFMLIEGKFSYVHEEPKPTLDEAS